MLTSFTMKSEECVAPTYPAPNAIASSEFIVLSTLFKLVALAKASLSDGIRVTPPISSIESRSLSEKLAF